MAYFPLLCLLVCFWQGTQPFLLNFPLANISHTRRAFVEDLMCGVARDFAQAALCVQDPGFLAAPTPCNPLLQALPKLIKKTF